jgi:hypothetical protein
MLSIETRVAKLERAAGDAGECRCEQTAGQSGLRVLLAGPLAESDQTRLCVRCGRERPVFEVGVTLETWELV